MAREEAPQDGFHWVRPPDKPIPYRMWEVVPDILHGVRDGRRGIPAATPEAPEEADRGGGEQDAGAVVPPRVAAISAWAQAEIAREWQLCHEDCLPYEGSLKWEKEVIKDLDAQIAEVERVLEETREQPKPDELAERRLAEEGREDRPDSLIRARRRRERERRRKKAEQRYRELLERRTQTMCEAHLLSAVLLQRQKMAQAGARRIHEHAHRRIATYLQALVRHHPKRGELRVAVDLVGPHLPDWVTAPVADPMETESLFGDGRNGAAR